VALDKLTFNNLDPFEKELGNLRNYYRKHISNVMILIDLHSEQFIKTECTFHKRSYDTLVKYVSDLKEHIINHEVKG
jgi:hypothetical protein